MWRNAGDWERFRTVWHPDGRMMATWFQGPAGDFIRVSQEGFARGVRILHFLGGTSIDLAGDRAIAQTKITIAQRGLVEDVLCDVMCTGRFYDFLERHDGRWGIVLRQPIYEKDRLDPVNPAARLELSPATLARFPEGYRHLASPRPASATTSRSICPVWPGRKPMPSTSVAPTGSPVARSTDPRATDPRATDVGNDHANRPVRLTLVRLTPSG